MTTKVGQCERDRAAIRRALGKARIEMRRAARLMLRSRDARSQAHGRELRGAAEIVNGWVRTLGRKLG